MSMKELAALAGVDISTVSRALRGDSRRVSAATMERVQALAERSGYITNPAASTLRSGRSKMLGVVVPILSDIVLAILVTAIEEASRELGYLSTVIATHGDPRVRADAIDRLLSRKVDGFILCDTEIGIDVPDRLTASGAPFVFAMRRSDCGASYTADDRRGGTLVAEHFLDMGHTSVAVVPGPGNAATALDRRDGFVDALLRTTDVEVLPIPSHGGFGVEDGHRSVNAILSRGDHPTAFFCTNDHTAIGAARALTDRGMKVGRDVALVGYNDIPAAAYLEPPLSSVRTDLRSMGRQATQGLISMIEGKAPVGIALEPTLVLRRSSTCWAIPPEKPNS